MRLSNAPPHLAGRMTFTAINTSSEFRDEGNAVEFATTVTNDFVLGCYFFRLQCFARRTASGTAMRRQKIPAVEKFLFFFSEHKGRTALNTVDF
jgi:hypothetical protein